MPKLKTSKKDKKSKKEELQGFAEIIKLTDNTRLVVNAITFDEDADEVVLNIRKWYRTKNDPTWKPARQGITVPMDKAKSLRVRVKRVAEAADENPQEAQYIKRGKDD